MKRLTGLLLLLLLMMPSALAGQVSWSAEEWAGITAALAAGEPDPVPAARRLQVRPGQLGIFAGLDRQWMNILLLSTDSPEIQENFGRSDVLLICGVNLKTGDTRLLSLPDEALLSISGLPEPIRLRHVNCFGGPLLTVKALNETLRLNISRYCAVNFDSFTQVVDALGGVRIPLVAAEAEALGLSPGECLLTGEQALRFVRLRQEGEDGQRPRRLLEAVLRQSLNQTSLNDALNLVEMLLPVLDTNLTTENLLDLMFALLGQETPGTFAAGSLSAGPSGALGAEAAQACYEFLYHEGE